MFSSRCPSRHLQTVDNCCPDSCGGKALSGLVVFRIHFGISMDNEKYHEVSNYIKLHCHFTQGFKDTKRYKHICNNVSSKVWMPSEPGHSWPNRDSTSAKKQTIGRVNPSTPTYRIQCCAGVTCPTYKFCMRTLEFRWALHLWINVQSLRVGPL